MGGSAAKEQGGIYRGLKILELGAGAAGPVATRYFAEQGATVLRIESAKRPDFLRLLHVTASNRDEPGILDKAPMFALLNPEKLSITLDMKKPEAVALVKRLARWCDVVSENFAPGVMERWGLAYESLRAEREDLIMVSGCLFGQTGPQKSYPGFGGQGAAIAGFNHLTGDPRREAHGPYATITDSLAPRYVAVAIAAALLERRHSGRGQYIDLSQIETGVYSLSQAVVRYSANGEIETRRENRDEFAAPHGVYPCSGDDRWIAIAVLDECAWDALVGVMGEPDWTGSPRFMDAGARIANQGELDEKLAAWSAGFDAYELMERLQAAGVEAGVVQNDADLLRDPQLAHREHFVRLEHPSLGELAFERSGFRIAGSEGTYTRPAPLMGEHNREILGGVLGLSSAEIDALVDEEVVV
ncbi:MAG: CoA transferase [Deltaproteobacteria bacterium]|nr:CoA transferase [Deltaproteobacteria bacterium]